MATTKNYFTGDGSTTDYTFTFEYLKTNYIKVKLDGVITTAYTLSPTNNPTIVKFTSAPASSVKIEIYRDTSLTSASVTHAAGSALKAANLNDNQTQLLHALEEQENSITLGEIFTYANANHSSAATAPSNPSAGDTWFDTTNGRTYIYYVDTDTNQWVENNPPFNNGGTISTAGTEPTIASGVITITANYHTVDTEGDGGSDDLTTINGGTTGKLLTLQAADSSRTVVVKDGTNLKTAGDFSLDNTEDTITLIYNGTNWSEISRSNNGS